jgi:ABC-type multidrug transport system fused ATPase/permease subunit
MIIWIVKKNMWDTTDFFKNFSKNFNTVEKLWSFFDNWKTIDLKNDWINFKYKNWNIEIKNTDFWYTDKKIFENFNLVIYGWKKTAIVWNSWWGKTTLMKLIAWYIKPQKWEIIIENNNLNDINLSSYYKHIWYLTQETNIFNWTIRENLLYCLNENEKNKITHSYLEKIINLSKCNFIHDLEKWLDTEIWDKWFKLSWWQKQRLNIAKLFIKDPLIILLDEATSSLDSIRENDVVLALNQLFNWRTIIIVAHKLQTVKNADDIIVMENSKIVERWNHNELIEKKWIYFDMVELQSWF